MKTTAALTLLVLFAAAEESHSALINVTDTDRELALLEPVLGGRITVQTTSTVRFDDVADTATLVDAAVQIRFPDTIQTSQRILETGTPNFPAPGPTRVTFTETITSTSFALSAPVGFVAGTSAPLVWKPSFQAYEFSPISVTLDFPDSFTVAGTYRVVGPSTTRTTPYSVRYNRTTSELVSGNLNGVVRPGANYPATADVSLVETSIGALRALYTPETRTVFSETIDGVNFEARLSDTQLRAFIRVPEPASWAMAAVGLAALRRRRS